MRSDHIEEFFHILQQKNPSPTTELTYTNPYTLLVAVVLSAQMTDTGVNKATRILFDTVTSPQDMLDLGEDSLRDMIRSVNFYSTKAKNVIALSRRLVDDYEGNVPQNREALESLPGVGRKTANVILNTAFHHPTIAVDTHILRVANRVGLSCGTTPLEVEKDLLKVIPSLYLMNAHHWLILHGRYVCKARKPLCSECPVSHLCKSYKIN